MKTVCNKCFLVGYLLISFFVGCNSVVNNVFDPNASVIKDSSGKIIEGTFYSYRADESPLSEVTYIQGKKNGKAITYYKDGKTIKIELHYQDDKKQGIQRFFYQSGSIYRESTFVTGIKDGLEKKYREDGSILSECMFKNGKPGKGIIEYLTNGKPKKKYPKIKIGIVDNLLLNGKYIVNISMSDKTKNVEYFFGELLEDKYLHDDLIRMVPDDNGILSLKYYLLPGHFIVEELHIVAKVKTRLYNYFITTRNYNLVIESNRSK